MGFVHRGGGAGFRGDVGGDRVSVDLGGDAPGSLGIDIGDGDARTGAGEQHRGQASAAVPAADDERGLVLETEELFHYFSVLLAGTGRARVADTIVIEDPARGVRLEVLAEGEGEPVVLVPSAMRGAADFA